MKKRDNIIAEEIIGYKFTGKETLEEVYNVFSGIMKKHKISQRTPVFDEQGKKIAEQGDNFEWTLYKTLWLSCVENWLTFAEWYLDR